MQCEITRILMFYIDFSVYIRKDTMDIEKLESEAKATAAKHVINMLQRPGQLEKV